MYGLDWSPAGDRIALGLEGDHLHLRPRRLGLQAGDHRWGTSRTGRPTAPRSRTRSYCLEDPNGCGLAIADADGSDDRAFDFGASGPWHPGRHRPRSLLPTDDVSPTPGPSALAYGVDGDVFLADADGSNPVRIAHGVPADGADECAPGEERAEYAVFGTAWSPDGRYLAYWDWGCPVPPGAWGTVLISDAEGNVIASFPGQGWTISWSPDSTRVAVMDFWAPAGQRDATIGVYGLDGTRQAALTVPSALAPTGDYSPVWSRDGASHPAPRRAGAPRWRLLPRRSLTRVRLVRRVLARRVTPRLRRPRIARRGGRRRTRRPEAGRPARVLGRGVVAQR